MKKLDQRGVGLLVICVTLIVVGLIAFAAMRIIDSQNSEADRADSTSQTELTQINSTESADAADKALDTAEADAALDEKQLDEDINSLL